MRGPKKSKHWVWDFIPSSLKSSPAFCVPALCVLSSGESLSDSCRFRKCSSPVYKAHLLSDVSHISAREQVAPLAHEQENLKACLKGQSQGGREVPTFSGKGEKCSFFMLSQKTHFRANLKSQNLFVIRVEKPVSTWRHPYQVNGQPATAMKGKWKSSFLKFS